MRITKPKKPQKPEPPQAAIAKHPTALSGMRWSPSVALSPANLLQLQPPPAIKRSSSSRSGTRTRRREASPR